MATILADVVLIRKARDIPTNVKPASQPESEQDIVSHFAEIGQHRPSWPGVGQMWAEFDRSSAAFDQIRPLDEQQTL